MGIDHKQDEYSRELGACRVVLTGEYVIEAQACIV